MNLLVKTIQFTTFLCITFCAIPTFAQSTNGHIPIYATPYYNYDPLTITIGKYKKELLTDDTSKIEALAKTIKNDINNTDIESIYFLSIRLYDLKKKDDAFYWFYTAQSRARIFTNTLNPNKVGDIGSVAFELKKLYIALNQLAGEYLNGYGFNDINKGIAVLERVKGEIKDIHSFRDIYKNVAFLNDDRLEIEKSKSEAGLVEFIDYLKTHKEEFRKRRIENGIQDKY